ncbi:hypothetical protein OVA06_17705 [Pseudarthrobacter sp. SL88]|nr:hypothetical protein [Pseudarthrobacter sp. SL88]MCY1676512.1 hypothetical protein [Pseudarthrobacter sp. SL88]
MSRDLRPVHTVSSEAAAKERFFESSGKLGKQYPAITRLWERPGASSALKCLYLATRPLDPTGKGRARWTHGGSWRPAPLPLPSTNCQVWIHRK